MRVKIKSLLILMAVLFSMNATAQNELKMDFAGFLWGNYGLSYEKILSNQMGVGGSANYYVITFDSFGDDDGIEFTGFNVAPEFRFYFNSRNSNSGYFAGPYVKFGQTSSNLFPYVKDEQWVDGSRTNTTVALGLGFGRKWVAPAGFVFETYSGYGKYLVDNIEYENKEQEEEYKGYDSAMSIFNFDWRVSVSVGWRFGNSAGRFGRGLRGF